MEGGQELHSPSLLSQSKEKPMTRSKPQRNFIRKSTTDYELLHRRAQLFWVAVIHIMSLVIETNSGPAQHEPDMLCQIFLVWANVLKLTHSLASMLQRAATLIRRLPIFRTSLLMASIRQSTQLRRLFPLRYTITSGQQYLKLTRYSLLYMSLKKLSNLCFS